MKGHAHLPRVRRQPAGPSIGLRLATIFGALAASVGAASPLAALATDAPATLRAEYEKPDEYGCKLPATAVQVLDLAGDGASYYVVDEGKLVCKGANPFCGSGGCGVSVYVMKNGAPKSILNDLVQRFRLRRAGRGYELLTIHKTVSPSVFRFAKGCSIEVGSKDGPSC